MDFKLFKRRKVDIGSLLTKDNSGKVCYTKDFLKKIQKENILDNYNLIAYSSKYIIYLKRKYPYKDIKKVKNILFNEIKLKFCIEDFIVYIHREKDIDNYVFHIFLLDKSLVDNEFRQIINLKNSYPDILGLFNKKILKIIKNTLKKDNFTIADVGASKINIVKIEKYRLIEVKKYNNINLSLEDILNILEKENVDFLIGGKVKELYEYVKNRNLNIFIPNNYLTFLIENFEISNIDVLYSSETKTKEYNLILNLASFLFISLSIILFIFSLCYKIGYEENTKLFLNEFQKLFSKPFKEIFILEENSKINYLKNVLTLTDSLENYNKVIKFLNKNTVNFTYIEINPDKAFLKFYIDKKDVNKIKDKIEIISSREDNGKIYIEGYLK